MNPVDFELLVQRALGVPDAVTEKNRERIAVLRLLHLAELEKPEDGQAMRWLGNINAIIPAFIEQAHDLAERGAFDFVFADVNEPFRSDRPAETLLSQFKPGRDDADELGPEAVAALVKALVTAIVDYVHAHPILESSISPQESEMRSETPRTSEK